MSDESPVLEALRVMREDNRSGFSDVRKDIGEIRQSVGDACERIAKVEEWKGDHKKFHEAHGEDTGVVDVKKSLFPRNGNKPDVKTLVQIGFGIGIGLMMVYNLYVTPSKADLEVTAERADSVAAVAEKDLKESRKSREEMKKVLQALVPLAEMLETEVTP